MKPFFAFVLGALASFIILMVWIRFEPVREPLDVDLLERHEQLLHQLETRLETFDQRNDQAVIPGETYEHLIAPTEMKDERYEALLRHGKEQEARYQALLQRWQAQVEVTDQLLDAMNYTLNQLDILLEQGVVLEPFEETVD